MKSQNIHHYLFSFLLLFLILFSGSTTVFASLQDASSQQDVFEPFYDEYVEGEDISCDGCDLEGGAFFLNGREITAPDWLRFGLIAIFMLIPLLILRKKVGWKLTGLLLVLVLVGFIPRKHECTEESTQDETAILTASLDAPEFLLDEPAEQNQGDAQQEENDEFESFNSESDDEFESFNSESDDEFQDISEFSEDEFVEFDDEFNDSAFGEDENYSIWKDEVFIISIAILLATALAGIFVRFKRTRKLRIFFLISSIVFLGFVSSGCPCMISSFQNVVLFTAVVPVEPVLLIWFLGLIPLTFFFGKVWCGWVCHLGALQEFLHRPKTLKILKNQKSQKILKYIQIGTLVVLIVQLFVTKTNIFIHYDPFKVAFNLLSANITGYVLLAVLLVSSLLIYRPFCRAFCPIGLILGWISRIKYSRKLHKTSSCVDCKSCSNACNYSAMIYEDKKNILNTDDCMLCGECFESCKKSALEINR